MAITLDGDCDEAIDLPECIRALSAIEGVWRRDRLDEAGRILRRLANNKAFLVAQVTGELERLDSIEAFQASSNFSQQIIDLGGGTHFRLRANMWVPCRGDEPADWEKSLFAYQMPHDHNADFLTVGYWGPGYETDIYEYDPERTVGYEGEQVEIRFLERTRLTPGKLMFYRANRDIHTQLPADGFSISLNLLAADPDSRRSARQYWFDVAAGRISASVERLDYTPFVFLCRLAAQIGDGATTEALERLAQGHVDPRVRGEAYRALVQLDPADADLHWRHACEDSDPYVRRLARGQLEPD